MRFTNSELTAFAPLNPAGFNTTEPVNFHECGDQIIILAEKIKAERAVCAMEDK